MLASLVHYFFPDLNKDEIKKFSYLSLTFFLIIGSYWLVRLLKTTVFMKIAFPESLGWAAEQGRLFQPLAKVYSPIVVLILVVIYSKLVDLVPKHVLFYIICTFYSLIFGIIGATLYVHNHYGDAYLGRTLLAAVGWGSYFLTESFGSLVVALFWSFTNSICTSESAKSGYPMILSCAQFGAILGSMLMIGQFDLWKLYFAVAICIGLVIIVIARFMKAIPASQMVGNRQAAATEKKEEGFLEGLLAGVRLLVTSPYIFGILIVSTIYEVINQIIEFQMNTQAHKVPEFATTLGFAQFQGYYGTATNILSFLMALLGTSYLIKRFGLRFGLLFYPICLCLAFSFLFAFYTFGMTTPGQLLTALFVTMMIAKGLGYAVNNPVKEMMYIPTSKDVKFKSKGFIDVFGGRMAKLGGGAINNIFKEHAHSLMVYGTMISFGLTGIWILAALFVGRKNAQLIADNEIVE
jgi:AAA family ATP:ADP antiporter